MTKLFLVLTLTAGALHAQPRTDSLLYNILARSRSELVKGVMTNPDTFRLQVIYTQIDRDKNNVPSFQNYYFHFDNDIYFNPASTVKLPLAALALEKLNRMGIKGVSKYTYMQFDSTYAGQLPVAYDSTSEALLPSISHYIKKAFLVSDNDAYNRMYQFVGQGPINEWLRQKGFQYSRITRQFMALTEEQNRHTNRIRFLTRDGKVIYVQPDARSEEVFDFSKPVKVGRAHIRNDTLIESPIDFTKANSIGLEDLQRMLQAIMFPESVPSYQRFNLNEDDFGFLYQYLSQYPSETNYPKYDTSQYYDSYVKFFFRGNRRMPSHVRVFNKVGWAYGFMTDVSYVVDFKNKIEFMLTATVYANSDGILNDDQYDYEQVGWPLLYDLGQTIYEYDLNRSRRYVPDLSRFLLHYEKRDPNDLRESLRDVDN